MISAKPSFSECYERLGPATITGRPATRFTIDAQGAVVDAQIEGGSLGSAALDSCFTDVIRGQAFPALPALPAGGTVEVRYPF